jgi:hypothetical protein
VLSRYAPVTPPEKLDADVARALKAKQSAA